jgi:hypothetical protein
MFEIPAGDVTDTTHAGQAEFAIHFDDETQYLQLLDVAR